MRLRLPLIAWLLTVLCCVAVHGQNYDGEPSNAGWRSFADQRIDQHRKADLVYQIADASPNTPVRVRMTRHAFWFVGSDNLPQMAGTSNPANVARRSVATSGAFNGIKGTNVKTQSWHGTTINLNVRDLQEVVLNNDLDVHGNQVMYRVAGPLLDGNGNPKQDTALYNAVADTWEQMLTTPLSGGQSIGEVARSWNLLNEAYGTTDTVYHHLSSSGNEAQRRARIIGFINNRANAWRNAGMLRDATAVQDGVRSATRRMPSSMSATSCEASRW